MAMRLPGGIRTEDQFWNCLIRKGDGHCEVPKNRYNADAFYHPTKEHCTRTKYGYFLKDDPACFDAQFFSARDHEAANMDPQQRLLLELVWECLESAGETNWEGRDIGCFVGVFGEDWLGLAHRDPQTVNRFHALGTGDYALANSISYKYDFRGPSMTIQTACSSSLVAVHEACQSLAAGTCSSAIVAGSNLIFTPTMTASLSDNTVLSPSGICRTFDANADGYGRGEAINVVYLKRLDKAVQANDPIRAVIRSTAVNFDGKTANITAPSVRSQESLIKSAYQRAGIDDPSETAFVECHGTATIAGDAVETTAVANCFKPKGVVIGAVKPNFGHSEGASGITSLIKAILSLERSTIPPNAHVESLNPRILESGLTVPLEPMDWPADRRLRVSINGFGVGGANAHVILDSTSEFSLSHHGPQFFSPLEGNKLLVVSARDPRSLQTRIQQVSDYANNNPDKLHDLAFTLGVRREHLPHRAVCVASSKTPIDNSMFQKSHAQSLPQLSFVFTGQGSQWAGMGKGLLETYDSFRADIMRLEESLKMVEDPPTWSLQEELIRTSESRVNEAEFCQPLCTAVQVGLVNLLASWGVKPEAVVGHSSGEIAAAYAAGALSESSAIILAYYRGKLAKSQTGLGEMASVGLSSDDVAPYLIDGVVIACKNSPTSVTLSGETSKIDLIVKMIRDELPDTFCKRLGLGVAYHSHYMKSVGPLYEASISRHLQNNPQMLPMLSSVTAEMILDPQELDAAYWRRNLESPVLFADAVSNLLANDKHHVFIEVGPHSALSGPLKQIFKCQGLKQSPFYIPTLVRYDTSSEAQLLSALGLIHINGAFVDLISVNGKGRPLTDLPPYPWQHGVRYWNESRLVREWRLNGTPSHELLGSRCPESTDLEPSWRNILSLESVPWLSGHVLRGQVVFPAAGYITMAGESIQQLTSETEGYTVKDVLFKSPLVIGDSSSMEIITSLRPNKVNDLMNSEWFAFSISSYNSKDWIENCSGHVRAGANDQGSHVQVEGYARRLSSETFYSALFDRGLSYGTQFSGLQNISADPLGGKASASVNTVEHNESPYLIHPAMIDQCLQLMTVAGAAGISRRIVKNAIPASVERMSIRRGGHHMEVGISVKQESANYLTGDATAVLDGKVVLSMTRGILFSRGEQGKAESIPLFSQMQWRPDIDFQHPQSLLPHTELSAAQVEYLDTVKKLSLLYILQTADKIKGIHPKSPHLTKWRSWILAEADRILCDSQMLDSNCEKWAGMSNAEKEAIIETLSIGLANEESPDGTIPAVCMDQIHANCQGIISDEVSALDLLLDDNRLGRYYAYGQRYANWDVFLTLLRHSKPGLRILEIGGGTGAATAAALQSLCVSWIPMYARYVFTDIAPSFLAAARSKFERYRKLEYKVLDICRDPLEQGFAANEFDLVIASNVLHATPILKHSLENVRKLLAPDGRFLLHELHSDMICTDYIMGTLPGWWVGEQDGRINKPYISPERWHQELQTAGFTGTEAVCHDFDAPYRSSATMITSPVTGPNIRSTVSLLVPDTRSLSTWANIVYSRLTDLGHTVGWTTLDDPPSETGYIICLLDQESSFLYGLAEERYNALRDYLVQASRCLVLWVTQSTQVLCQNPKFGLAPGFVRSTRHDLMIDFCLLEVESFDLGAADALGTVLGKISQSREASNQSLDYEFALCDGIIHTARCYWGLENGTIVSEPKLELPKRLHFRKSGLLDSLRWLECREQGLGDDDVEVDIHYIGLNFRDVLVAMGFFGDADQLGVEGSGTLRRVGNHVTDLVVGDRVLVLGPGIFGTRLVVDRQRCRKLDKGLSLEDAANMALVYMTAMYCLVYVGQIKKGQTVLVHSACGGFGMAAIQVCTLLGAEIFATVGNQTKRDHLIHEFDIPPDHIFDSRSASFLQSLMEATGGRGVEIVLNSLAGNLLHASWECVAPFGKMIELGKRDFILNGALSLKPFLNNRAFFGVDLLGVAEADPETLHREITQIISWYEEGKILPIRPVTVFEACDVADAFRYMQQGTHMGKIVIRMPHDSYQLPSPMIDRCASFPLQASYLLVGGLGGLGRAVSTWMVERGARHLVYLSRDAGARQEDREFIFELEMAGCHVQCVKGNVANLEDVQRAVSKCKEPLKGVLQMSLCLRDSPFAEMSYEDWQASMAPKVQGTWNLHIAVTKEDLDFFVLFGSVVGLCGNLTQVNYAAANTFLDAFSHYRRQLSLPSSVLTLGAVGEIGLISRQPRLLQSIKSLGAWLLKEDEVLKGLEMCILQSHAPSPTRPGIQTSTPIIVGLGHTRPLSDPTVRPMWYDRDARFASYTSIESSSEQQSDDASSNLLRDLVLRAEREPSIVFTEEARNLIIKETVRVICMYLTGSEDIDDEQKLAIVIDSLASIEIKSWVRRNLGLEVSVPDIAKSRTVGGLAQLAVDRLKAHFKARMEDMDDAHEGIAAEVPD
ncbi:putative polyketide synthase [Aspergillus sclerotioniger CBS 115572]|uniref:Putative polyketide synthase n=1 Tax=Aspergillus sclerotioniger CBS 115572 TaxID=1450535 RepID=A0A317V9U8_9EURO|nr:putative polyketide synthase [Aspergillus sclerotioniger CBS 115572]PWY71104.1 putative polyketide synthase [Aspergillus sclerotioniger CBS 115572]